MRVDRIVSAACGLRLKAAASLVRERGVLVDGTRIFDPEWQVVLGAEDVQLQDDTAPLPQPFHRVVMIHKPRNCICERARGSRSWLKSRGLATGSHGSNRSGDSFAKEEDQGLSGNAPEVHCDASATSDASTDIVCDGDVAMDESMASDLAPNRAANAVPGNDARMYIPTVYDMIPERFAHASLGLFGRLDRDTTGLLLAGTDGGLQQLLTHPAAHCKKVYVADLLPHADRVLSPTACRDFEEGLVLPDGVLCKPAKLEVVGTSSLLSSAMPSTLNDESPSALASATLAKAAAATATKAATEVPAAEAAMSTNETNLPSSSPSLCQPQQPQRVRVTLHEGFYHQVKRMIGAVGGGVAQLHREALGPLTLDPDLRPGDMRLLTPEELKAIARSCPPEARTAKGRDANGSGGVGGGGVRDPRSARSRRKKYEAWKKHKS